MSCSLVRAHQGKIPRLKSAGVQVRRHDWSLSPIGGMSLLEAATVFPLTDMDPEVMGKKPMNGSAQALY